MPNIHSELTGAELHAAGYVSATDPGAVGAGHYWIDTSDPHGTPVLKVRNDADTGWLMPTGVESIMTDSSGNVLSDSDGDVLRCGEHV